MFRSRSSDSDSAAGVNPAQERELVDLRGQVDSLTAEVAAQKTEAANAQGLLRALDRVQATIEFTLDGTILTANDNFLRTVGYSLAEIRGQHHRMFADPDYARTAEYREFWARLGRGEYDAGEYRRLGKGGREVWLQASYNPIFDANGRPVKVVKFATDITAQKQLTVRMDALVAQVRSSVGEVTGSAEEIAKSADSLNHRVESQAASLEQTAASMEEITSTVRQNADNAAEARRLAMASREQAERGGAVVDQAVVAMHAINESSRKIADIIGVIDEIAFQTNLLALNAAVEAARAGDQGRGFAVVATEVRGLAGRSAEAAKQIKALISDSVGKVAGGSTLVAQSGETLGEIMASVKKVSDIVSEIAAACSEQSTGIDQIGLAITQMDEATQQNAAMVEESTAAAQAILEQTRALQSAVNGGASAPASPAARPRLRAAR